MVDEVKPWFDGLAEPIKAHITNQGLDKEEAPAAAAKLAQSHYAAQRLIGVPPEQLVRLPKDVSDPAYAEAYNRVASAGAYKEPEKYVFPEGTPEDVVAKARETAVALGLPQHVATAMASRMATEAAQATIKATADREAAVGASQMALRHAWGTNYDLNLFKATKAAEAAGWDKPAIDAMQAAVGSDKTMNLLLNLASKMGEADILRSGGQVAPPTLTRDQALARRAEILTSASQRKFTPQEYEAAQKEIMALAVAIVGPPPQR